MYVHCLAVTKVTLCSVMLCLSPGLSAFVSNGMRLSINHFNVFCALKKCLNFVTSVPLCFVWSLELFCIVLQVFHTFLLPNGHSAFEVASNDCCSSVLYGSVHPS